MLTRLLPDQISEHWNIIGPAIEASLPPVASKKQERMNRVLMSLLSSKSQCWASYVVEGEVRRFEGIMTTKIFYDHISDCKSLLIYSLYSYSKVSRESWIRGLKSLAKYAMSKNCESIVAYTNVPFLIEMARKLGGNATHTFVSLPLNTKVEHEDNN